jgi:hypothetical protein
LSLPADFTMFQALLTTIIPNSSDDGVTINTVWIVDHDYSKLVTVRRSHGGGYFIIEA